MESVFIRLCFSCCKVINPAECRSKQHHCDLEKDAEEGVGIEGFGVEIEIEGAAVVEFGEGGHFIGVVRS